MEVTVDEEKNVGGIKSIDWYTIVQFFKYCKQMTSHSCQFKRTEYVTKNFIFRLFILCL